MLRKVLFYPDPKLAKVSAPITEITDEIKKIAADMLDTLKHVGGVGLAAPQIGELYRMILVDKNLANLPENPEENSEKSEKERVQDFMLIINPELTILDNKKHVEYEGCLSVDDFRSDVSRPCHVKVTGVDINNNPVELEGKKFLSSCIQHECDHLDGKTFLEHISFLKRSLYQKKLKKR